MIVEVHPCPQKAVSDGAQSLTIEGFAEMMQTLKGYRALWKQERMAELVTA
jgi:3-deoxy-7-phosphoheptulonate synthase